VPSSNSGKPAVSLKKQAWSASVPSSTWQKERSQDANPGKSGDLAQEQQHNLVLSNAEPSPTTPPRTGPASGSEAELSSPVQQPRGRDLALGSALTSEERYCLTRLAAQRIAAADAAEARRLRGLGRMAEARAFEKTSAEAQKIARDNTIGESS
jgi:hypothetical protein